ncbi:hypothetical protein ACA910_003165 [Epithemia clementina (nom. ined.)]
MENKQEHDSDDASGGGGGGGGVARKAQDSEGEEQLPPPKKKRKSPAIPWKKPKDMPKRPLSAYNLFFRDERERMTASRGYRSTETPTITKASKKKEEPSSSRSSGGGGGGGNDKPAKKSSGTGLGFARLAQTIAAKWKELDSATRAPYEHQAAVDKERYDKAVAIWREEQARKKPMAEQQHQQQHQQQQQQEQQQQQQQQQRRQSEAANTLSRNRSDLEGTLGSKSEDNSAPSRNSPSDHTSTSNRSYPPAWFEATSDDILPVVAETSTFHEEEEEEEEGNFKEGDNDTVDEGGHDYLLMAPTSPLEDPWSRPTWTHTQTSAAAAESTSFAVPQHYRQQEQQQHQQQQLQQHQQNQQRQRQHLQQQLLQMDAHGGQYTSSILHNQQQFDAHGATSHPTRIRHSQNPVDIHGGGGGARHQSSTIHNQHTDDHAITAGQSSYIFHNDPQQQQQQQQQQLYTAHRDAVVVHPSSITNYPPHPAGHAHHFRGVSLSTIPPQHDSGSIFNVANSAQAPFSRTFSRTFIPFINSSHSASPPQNNASSSFPYRQQTAPTTPQLPFLDMMDSPRLEYATRETGGRLEQHANTYSSSSSYASNTSLPPTNPVLERISNPQASQNAFHQPIPYSNVAAAAPQNLSFINESRTRQQLHYWREPPATDPLLERDIGHVRSLEEMALGQPIMYNAGGTQQQQQQQQHSDQIMGSLHLGDSTRSHDFGEQQLDSRVFESLTGGGGGLPPPPRESRTRNDNDGNNNTESHQTDWMNHRREQG